MKHHDDLAFWRAERLQHLAGKAINKVHRCEPLSAKAHHHYCRYLKLLHHSNDAATTEIYTLSLRDALPICLAA